MTRKTMTEGKTGARIEERKREGRKVRQRNEKKRKCLLNYRKSLHRAALFCLPGAALDREV